MCSEKADERIIEDNDRAMCIRWRRRLRYMAIVPRHHWYLYLHLNRIVSSTMCVCVSVCIVHAIRWDLDDNLLEINFPFSSFFVSLRCWLWIVPSCCVPPCIFELEISWYTRRERGVQASRVAGCVNNTRSANGFLLLFIIRVDLNRFSQSNVNYLFDALHTILSMHRAPSANRTEKWHCVVSVAMVTYPTPTWMSATFRIREWRGNIYPNRVTFKFRALDAFAGHSNEIMKCICIRDAGYCIHSFIHPFQSMYSFTPPAPACTTNIHVHCTCIHIRNESFHIRFCVEIYFPQNNVSPTHTLTAHTTEHKFSLRTKYKRFICERKTNNRATKFNLMRFLLHLPRTTHRLSITVLCLGLDGSDSCSVFFLFVLIR